ncbi:MAG: N-acetylmuramoyl-L-alanine amidase-like domain-containing protein [Candidatus Eremiobacterota bacterium]
MKGKQSKKMNRRDFLKFFLCAIIASDTGSFSSVEAKGLTEDEKIFLDKISMAEKNDLFKKPLNNIIIETGKSFLKTPYVADTLDNSGRETLVTNLHGLDCWTFFENTLTISRVIKKREKTFKDYKKELEFIRYRNGIRNGYTSRLHYFTDWIYDNSKKGVVKDINRDLGGIKLNKKINFMTSHRESYPPLKSDEEFNKLKKIEKEINSRVYYYVPTEMIPKIEDKLKDGDIIGLGTTIEGLDVTHTGYIYKIKNISHMLNASSKTGYVEISDCTLYDYLISVEKPGIIVARALDI